MSKRRQMLTGRQRASGLSLIEILVALGLGLVLIAGATNLFIGSSQTFRANESYSRMQEESRFAFNRLQRDGRSAGFRSCSSNRVNLLNNAGSGDLDEQLWFDLPVMGWEFDDTGPDSDDVFEIENFDLPADGDSWSNGAGGLHPSLVGNVVRGTDVLVLSGTRRLGVNVAGVTINPNNVTIDLGAAANIGQNDLFMISDTDCSAGNLVQKRNQANDRITISAGGNNPGNSQASLTYTPNLGIEILQIQTRAYFVGMSDGEPALFTQRLEPNGGAAQELIRGVENMQVLYGVAGGSNAVSATQYVPADNVNDWSDVVSVRLALLLRSPDNSNPDTNTRTYNLLGLEVDPTPDTAAGPGGDRRLRVLATQTIGLRNRLR
ncbi:MAG: PilW family protein [Natronospirillum sp.]|uniref:PilW family protein n=1 Tax=Natronospirillum sp. TaxID=2812955 RepID=UPI0025E6B8DF|nr:PilW family protein [Natronospirillum sp.]MCH8550506.1 PilW family protein [Natronospirillum sp.]